ncbi:MAG: hypothetical protein J6T33_08780 [Bacteroidales bacterium]|nr:hypothetical protein [Bacteroidales bacterium]MBP5240470.1 hypothetical protein [Bacteroidales bacterium]
MKKIITTLALCLMAATAFSQSAESMTLESGPQKFFSFEAFYGPSKYLYTGDDLTIKDEEPFTQIGLVISNNNPLSKKINLYLNWGVGFVFSQYKDESEPFDFFGYQKTTKTEFLYFSALYKANVGYLLTIPNTTVAFFPYVGIYGHMHIGGNLYYTFPNLNTEKNEIFDDQKKYSLFTESADNPDPWKRFEAGWNFGINAYFGTFMVGVAYGKTFTDLTKDTRTSELRLSAGLRF